MDDRTYNVRLNAQEIINPFTIELKGCGSLQLIPGCDYYFINAPINFIDYVVQLAAMNVKYSLTENRDGCLYVIDLKDYNSHDPRLVASRYRKINNVTGNENPVISTGDDKVVVLSSDDITPREEVSSEEAELNKMIAEDQQKVEEQTIDVVAEEIPEAENLPISDETDLKEEEEKVEEESKEPKVYSEDELSKFSKAMLLEISADYNLECSDINTKKEIREAIIAAQNK